MVRENILTLEAYEQKAREELRRMCASLRDLPQDARSAYKTVIQGTTILGANFQGENGSRPAVLACDGQTTKGYEKYCINTDKIDRLDVRSAMASTGYAAPSMLATQFLRAIFRIVRLYNKQELSALGKARQINNLVGEFFSCDEYFFLPLFITYDLIQNRARIFDIWGSHGYQEWHDYCTNGCGGDLAMGVLDEHWTPTLTQDEAVDLAIRAIHAAAHRTCGANEPQYVRIMTAHDIEDVPRRVIQQKLDVLRKTCKGCERERRRGMVR